MENKTSDYELAELHAPVINYQQKFIDEQKRQTVKHILV